MLPGTQSRTKGWQGGSGVKWASDAETGARGEAVIQGQCVHDSSLSRSQDVLDGSKLDRTGLHSSVPPKKLKIHSFYTGRSPGAGDLLILCP